MSNFTRYSVSFMKGPGSFRVTAVRAAGEFPGSWIVRLLRRIPLVRRLLSRRDAAATAQLRVDQVAVGNWAACPAEIASLPIAPLGTEIVACVVNVGERPVVARVHVDGVLA